jgi:hypothetical protein
MNKMNKKLSIIMLLSCVGNVFSMNGGGAAGGGDQIPSGLTEKSYAIACQAGKSTCSFLSKAGNNLAEVGRITLSKVSSVSREAAEFVAAHPAGACVAAVAACGLGWGIHKRRQATAEAKQEENYKKLAAELDDEILWMHSRGMTTREIESHLQEIYGIENIDWTKKIIHNLI